jgi:ribosomal protein S18 acetylase RimI-like enzyme
VNAAEKLVESFLVGKIEKFNLTLLVKPSVDLARELTAITQTNMEELYNECPEPEWKWNTDSKLKSLLKCKVITVHDESGFLVGFLAFRFLIDSNRPVAYVYELQVVQSCTGRGLGSLLMSELERLCTQLIPGISHIVLTCFLHNSVGLRFYKRIGYATDMTSPREGTSYVILSKAIK